MSGLVYNITDFLIFSSLKSFRVTKVSWKIRKTSIECEINIKQMDINNQQWDRNKTNNLFIINLII